LGLVLLNLIIYTKTVALRNKIFFEGFEIVYFYLVKTELFIWSVLLTLNDFLVFFSVVNFLITIILNPNQVLIVDLFN